MILFLFLNYAFAQTPGKAQVVKPLMPKPMSVANLSDDVHQLLSIVAEDRKFKAKVPFVARGCDTNKMEWLRMALTRSKRLINYVYNKDCDVTGKFYAELDRPFDMKLKVRHLASYQTADMKVQMGLSPMVGEIEFKFDCLHGVLKSPKEKVEFKAWYKMRIDPLSGGEEKRTGEITILKVNDKIVNLKKKIGDV